MLVIENHIRSGAWIHRETFNGKLSATVIAICVIPVGISLIRSWSLNWENTSSCRLLMKQRYYRIPIPFYDENRFKIPAIFGLECSIHQYMIRIYKLASIWSTIVAVFLAFVNCDARISCSREHSCEEYTFPVWTPKVPHTDYIGSQDMAVILGWFIDVVSIKSWIIIVPGENADIIVASSHQNHCHSVIGTWTVSADCEPILFEIVTSNSVPGSWNYLQNVVLAGSIVANLEHDEWSAVRPSHFEDAEDLVDRVVVLNNPDRAHTNCLNDAAVGL